jgi:outer membrane protein OmpA-like peptidoglycan-associated protein
LNHRRSRTLALAVQQHAGARRAVRSRRQERDTLVVTGAVLRQEEGNRMKIHESRSVLALVGALMLFATTGAIAADADLRATLFGRADAALAEANAARASVLAPKSYAEAATYYRSAEDKLARGRGIESIQSDLAKAVEALNRAAEATRLAQVTLGSALEARDDADAAEAETFAPDAWQRAEERFASAAVRLEEGSVNAAKSRGDDAEELYREAELAAIKANYLDETRRLIERADDDRVDRYAPTTIARAKRLLEQAEAALTADRYDTDQPRSLARQAKAEVRHAMYLAETLKPVRDRKVELETYALAAEAPIVRIAGALDLVIALDEGMDPPTEAIIAEIEALQRDAYELTERRVQIDELQAEIQRLEREVGTQSASLAAQEEQRRRLLQIEALFGPDEAQVLTQGQSLLIRPIGLAFPPGSAQIESQYFELLAKIQQALRLLPDTTITVEGHTDSFGSDAANLLLSEQRAEAVRDYLLANMRDLKAEDVQSLGFGEARPVANNETQEGRTKNRRIDLVIRPRALSLGGGAQ